jgi:hypothetical protein
MAGGRRLISWLHPCSTSNVALNTRTCAHGSLMGHPNWAGCDTLWIYRSSQLNHIGDYFRSNNDLILQVYFNDIVRHLEEIFPFDIKRNFSLF